MQCIHCSANAPKDAHFCPQCGYQLVSSQHPVSYLAKPSYAWGTLLMTLCLSIGLSLLLTVVFHLPIFILAAALPLLWVGRRRNNG